MFFFFMQKTAYDLRISYWSSAVGSSDLFYGESGGQVGDAGIFCNVAGWRAIVADTKKHLCRVWAHRATIEKGAVAVGDPIRMEVDPVRRAAIRANHSAPHLLHAALREIGRAHV